MAKPVTISSLVRQAAKTEADFATTVQTVFDTETPERIAEFFDRLNVPRSVEGSDFLEPLPVFEGKAEDVGDYAEEHAIAAGMQKYMDRHLKKIKWHAQRPSIEGVRNSLLVMREAMAVTDVRIRRLVKVLDSKDELTPDEWAMAREMMNRAYLSFRHFLIQFGGPWVDAAIATVEREELEEMMSSFYELIDDTIRTLEEQREKIEARRVELTVLPPGFDPVKPPIYFGGDLMGRGPWKQFWTVLEDRAHHFREALG